MAAYLRRHPTADGFYLLHPGQDAGFRRLMRAPILLWRLGLDRLPGKLFMLMTTRGRRSGLPRRAIVDYHTIDGRKLVISGYGPDSDWYKNLMADPYATVQTADGVERMRARRITDPQELKADIEALQRKFPELMDAYLTMGGYEKFTPEFALSEPEKLYLIEFSPTDEDTPPPVEADLKWLSYVGMGILVSLVASAIAAVLARWRDD